MSVAHYDIADFNPVTSLGYLVRRCGIMMSLLTERIVRREQLSFAQQILLLQLFALKKASATQLSQLMGYDNGSMTRLLDSLESPGLVSRERSRLDRRTVSVTLTTKGLSRIEETKVVMVSAQNDILSSFSESDVKTMRDLLSRLHSVLSKKLDMIAVNAAQ